MQGQAMLGTPTSGGSSVRHPARQRGTRALNCVALPPLTPLVSRSTAVCMRPMTQQRMSSTGGGDDVSLCATTCVPSWASMVPADAFVAAAC